MLEYPVLFTMSFGWYGNKKPNYSRHYMLAFPLLMEMFSEDYYYSIDDILDILCYIIFSFFSKIFGKYGNKEGIYSRNSILSFTIIMSVTSEDYYS